QPAAWLVFENHLVDAVAAGDADDFGEAEKAHAATPDKTQVYPESAPSERDTLHGPRERIAITPHAAGLKYNYVVLTDTGVSVTAFLSYRRIRSTIDLRQNHFAWRIHNIKGEHDED
ncbi:hypothetical protein, partial [Propionivibrio sp.]|uniref:hypothetical protein n=1 Tax=Propionivibrio sp. TaxID=2212460 RepID=UPI0026211926